jgi:hypothetical protein
MNPEDTAVEAKVYAACPPNVIIYSYISFEDIEGFFARAFVFISTSEFEGFPNTFLQAGKYGVPILSYKVDPDGFIEANEAGIVAHGSFDRLKAGLRLINDNPYKGSQFSHNVFTYVKNNHDLNEKVRLLHQIIQEVNND